MGHRVYFTTAIDLARRMARAIAENRLSREIKNLTRPKLLIIDEVGYLALEQAHASLLFQAICERYEKRQAVILTSNKGFADWGQVFAGDTIMASAALDRLLHRSTVINIRAIATGSRKNGKPSPPMPQSRCPSPCETESLLAARPSLHGVNSK
jgi:DNA replication protein DnaC